MRFEPKAFKGKCAGVIGLGRSGLAGAKLLAKKGFKVFASDSRRREELRKNMGRLPGAISWEAGRHSDRLLKCAFVLKSPGLSPSLPIFQKLKKAAVPVFSELEVALAFCKARTIVAITGTNGKSTTAELAAEIFRAASSRRRVYICGNIGVPVCALAAQARAQDVLIIEASSYQLEDSRFFHPGAAALLNITADHIDHHGGMARYIEAKARIFKDQTRDDVCVFNAADPLALKLSRRCPARKLFFGPPGQGPVNAWHQKGKIHVRGWGGRDLALAPPRLPGEHNIENAMAAALLALTQGVKSPAVQKGLRSFKGVAHRLQELDVIRGIRCINDSKATNVDSTMVALKALSTAKSSILLILGGLHKGSPYGQLRPLIESCVKGILTIGSAAGKIEEELSGTVPIFPCADLPTAVETAFKIGAKGDTLLLSPACASFDQFTNFEERGARFMALVEEHK